MIARADGPPARPLRILLVLEASGGGAGRHTLDLARGLLARGHSVALAWSPLRAESGFRDALAGLTTLRTHSLLMQRAPGPGDAAAALALRRVIKTRGPFDLVHGHSSKAGALARLAALGLGVPVLYTPHALVTMDPGLGRLHFVAYRVAENLLALLGDRIICVSDEEREHARSLGIGASKLAVVPNGIAPLPPADRNAMRRALGLDDATPCAGFVGRLSSQKAVARLVRAFAVAPGRERSRLVIAGDGPDRATLEMLARDLGIADRVIFTGQVDGPALMAALDFFVLPSRYEAFPYVLLEAAARALPIVAMDVGGAHAVVRDGENGFIVPQGDDPAALASRIGALLSDAGLRRAMSARSLERMPEFSCDRMVERTLDVYREVLPDYRRVPAAQ